MEQRNSVDREGRLRVVALQLAFMVVLLIVWHAIVAMGFVTRYLVPSPVDVGKAAYDLFQSGVLWKSVGLSLYRMICGYSVSLVLGTLLGILLARNWVAKATLGSLVLALQSLPSICWLPFALLWVGIDERAILAVVILGATFSIATATENAVRNVPPIYLKVGQVLGARGFTFARDILFFAALPEWLGGMKLGWSFAWRSLMAAELIRQDALGIGRLLEIGRAFNDVPMMLASMVLIVALGMAVDWGIFGVLERQVRRVYGLEK
ncbi:MAG: ABC transporter permease [Candidatus Sumerlaeaceae bacterium]|nr:ABC transporter permease [Candidatus Sumerlaeaceae bacterium]